MPQKYNLYDSQKNWRQTLKIQLTFAKTTLRVSKASLKSHQTLRRPKPIQHYLGGN